MIHLIGQDECYQQQAVDKLWIN